MHIQYSGKTVVKLKYVHLDKYLMEYFKLRK